MILDVPAVLAVTLAGFALCFWVADRTRTLAPALVAFGVHLVAALGAYLTVGLLMPDAILYDRLASGYRGEEVFDLPLGKEGWTAVLEALYAAFGHEPAVGLAANVTAATLTVSVFARAAAVLGLPARATAWLVALLPSGVLWSSLLLREAFTWLFLAVAILGFAGLATKARPWGYAALAIGGLVALFPFRASLALIAFAGGLLAVPLARGRYLALGTALALGGAFTLSPLGAPVREVIGQYDLERVLVARQWLSDFATTGFPVDNLAEVAVRVLLGPFPWEWPLVGAVFAADAVVWLAVLAAVTAGALRGGWRPPVLVVLIPAAILYLSLVLTSGNYGTLQRLRVQPELLLLPLAALGIAELRQLVRRRPTVRTATTTQIAAPAAVAMTYPQIAPGSPPTT